MLQVGWHGYPVSASHVHPDRVFVSGPVLPVVNGNGAMAAGRSTVYIDGLPVSDDEVIRFDSLAALLVHAARAIRTCLALDSTASRYAADPLPANTSPPGDGAGPREDETIIEDLLTKWEIAPTGGWGVHRRRVGRENVAVQRGTDPACRTAAARRVGDSAGGRHRPGRPGCFHHVQDIPEFERCRQDLIDFTFAPYVAAVEQRLSMGDVTPAATSAKSTLTVSSGRTRKRGWKRTRLASGSAYTQEEIRELEDRPANSGHKALSCAAARKRGDAGHGRGDMKMPDEDSKQVAASQISFVDDEAVAASFSADLERRIISGIIVPWNRVAKAGGAVAVRERVVAVGRHVAGETQRLPRSQAGHRQVDPSPQHG